MGGAVEVDADMPVLVDRLDSRHYSTVIGQYRHQRGDDGSDRKVPMGDRPLHTENASQQHV